MVQRSEILTVYVAGVIQGIALVTFPAASAVFTSSSDYNFSSTECGCMFIPQVVTAITSSLLGTGLTRRLGAKYIYLLGLVANLFAMSLLFVRKFAMREHLLAYGILLVATFALLYGVCETMNGNWAVPCRRPRRA
ncbi:MAG TPA: hypothetical protein VHY30_04390 [Verrucomicrobiae bacterium]|jgi:MFS-type transporter involved in bile tolerance (Atg22 family)|nr:hypothetical protein [Verrucomicrobiae bacterium]